MLSRFYQVRHGLAQRHLLAFDNLHNKVPAIPRIFFTHDNYLKDYTKQAEHEGALPRQEGRADGPRSGGRRRLAVLPVEVPDDQPEEEDQQLSGRRGGRLALRLRHDAAVRTAEDHRLHERLGSRDSTNIKRPDGDPLRGYARRSAGDAAPRPRRSSARPATVARSSARRSQFASVENMRQLEQKRVFWLSGRRMLAKDRSNPNTYKVRRAKVGGYRDDFTPEQLAAIDALVDERLLPVFGYGRGEPGQAGGRLTDSIGSMHVRLASGVRRAVKPCVFIHTNARQIVGALVARHALKRNSRQPDAFDVRIIHTEDYPFLAAREGQPFKRDGITRIWRNDDLQSFTPLRFMPPGTDGLPGPGAGHRSRHLRRRRRLGAAVARHAGSGSHVPAAQRTEGRLRLVSPPASCCSTAPSSRHWRCEEQFDELFEFKRDYMDWISLKLEPRETIGLFEKEWNDFDRLTPATKMLHNTRRITQPWKTGLPIDFEPPDAFKPIPLYAG